MFLLQSVVYPLPGVKQKVSVEMMCRLLNSKPIDMRYRQVSGTVSISVKLLREIPLPPPMLITKILHNNLTAEEWNKRVEDCYRKAGKV